MNHFSNTVLWIYIVLLLVGGLIGFYKAKSQVSLIASAIFAALLVLTAVPGIFEHRFAMDLSNVIMAVVLCFRHNAGNCACPCVIVNVSFIGKPI